MKHACKHAKYDPLLLTLHSAINILPTDLIFCPSVSLVHLFHKGIITRNDKDTIDFKNKFELPTQKNQSRDHIQILTVDGLFIAMCLSNKNFFYA